MRCPRCSGRLIEDQPTCPECGWQRPVRPAEPEATVTDAAWLQETEGLLPGGEGRPLNNSGTNTPPPDEVRRMGFCWGGFALPLFFSFANNITLGCILYLVFGIVSAVWLGLLGHEEAWKHRRFQSLAQFHRTMRVWNACGKIAVVLHVVAVLFPLALFLASPEAFRLGSFDPATDGEVTADICRENLQSIAEACLMYSKDYDDRLPPAGDWHAALTPLLPGHRWPVCPLKTSYQANPNVCGRSLRGMPRTVVLVYEADGKGRLAHVHPCPSGGKEAGVAFSDGEATTECTRHPGRMDWWGPPPPGLVSTPAAP
ncbi:hypothetical protein LLH23_13765 [bacterium]|nr:hypothetical protein [bacterium]